MSAFVSKSQQKPSLSLSRSRFSIISYIDLEKFGLVVVRIKELLLHAVAMEVGVAAA